MVSPSAIRGFCLTQDFDDYADYPDFIFGDFYKVLREIKAIYLLLSPLTII